MATVVQNRLSRTNRDVADKPVEDADRTRPLTPQETEWKQRINEQLLTVLDLSLIDSVDTDKARKEIREIVERLLTEASAPLSRKQRQLIVERIEDEVMGLGPLEPLLADNTISDILVNGFDTIYIERHGKLELTNARFTDPAHLLNTIDRIVSNVGRRIDESSPMVDARLADGSRVNAIIPPLAIDGASLSIRRFGVELLSMDSLIKLGSVTEEVAKVLSAVVKARLNILVSGGTGSGKTTMLNILSGYIPDNERIVTIEDSAELQLQQPHVVRLETRPPNIESKGEVTSRDLVRNSLRMRPERIVIGEVRGGEALDMLQAMNTGHDGSLTTIHANSPRDALGRIENMVFMTGIAFLISALRAQIASAINIVLQISRLEDGKRKLVSIQEINGMEGDIITMSELFTFQREGLDEDGNVLGTLQATGIIPAFHKGLAQRGIDLPIEVFEPNWSETGMKRNG
jgi:pilus assembly protein CpaF